MFGSRKKMIRERMRRQWGRNPLEDDRAGLTARRMERVRILYDVMAGDGGCGGIDDITWQDLEMDEVFWRLNNTKSFAGEQELYRRLHGADGETDWEQYEKRLDFFSREEELRVEIEVKLNAIGKPEDAYELPKFLANTKLWRIGKGWYLHVLQILLLMFFITSIILDNMLCIAGLIVTALTNLMVWLYMKQRYEGFLTALGRLKQIYDFVRWLTEDARLKELFGSEEVNRAVKGLKGLSKLIADWNGRKYAGLSGDIAGIVSDYLWGITLLDVASFNYIMKVIGDRREEVLAIVGLAGSVDAELAAASWRAGQSEYCIPGEAGAEAASRRAGQSEYCMPEGAAGAGQCDTAEAAERRTAEAAGENRICVERLVHPLLKEPAANDFVLEKRAIITGANASGKSTFMKALAVNMILAQTVHTCTAAHFSAPELHVMTCMSLKDDILSGESYYLREAKYLKRMLDVMEQGVPVLCVLDEILKGTNTRERLAASDAILEYIAASDCFVLAATHDMELAQRPDYGHYYFESRIEDSDIVFDYRIHEGLGGASNAIALLAALGFPETVVERARGNAGNGTTVPCGGQWKNPGSLGSAVEIVLGNAGNGTAVPFPEQMQGNSQKRDSGNVRAEG